ncbi:MAG TPA: carbon-nitrogen hydrolase family protein [Pyrinomonadaceae bacterium]|nr:carbon-nitrogen hydrolase family protein [Pyrinomonadaceae bacterium]
MKLRVATCQFPVSRDIAGNAKFIRRFMMKAAAVAAHAVHFPETALSGYGRPGFTPSCTDNWQELERHTQEIIDLAGKLGLWVVLGSCRKVANREKPTNCIHVVSNKGRIVGTYDKRQLTPSESAWYTPGDGFLVITINGIKCGFLICYEACFPDLFEAYRKKGVRLIFHSCHNVSGKPRPLFQELTLAQLRTRAADNHMWISGSNSAARYSFSTACIARPDGSVRCAKRHVNGLLLHDFPDTKLGWTYDNRKNKPKTENTDALPRTDVA